MTITSVKNGKWVDPTIWDLKRVPKDGDIINICHKVECTSDQKSVKGCTIIIDPGTGTLDTRHIKFAGLRSGGISQTSQE